MIGTSTTVGPAVDAAEGTAEPRVAVILPCHNEAAAIAVVVAEFKKWLPAAAIFVIDNRSTDGTADVAAAAGALVLEEQAKGKGNAIRRAFTAIDADVYVMADGDGTYDASQAPRLVAMLWEKRLDMVVGARRKVSEDAYRLGHQLGNRLFNRILKSLFNSDFRDVFSGYRVLSNRYVKSFPAMSDGFEIETEMTVHAILLRMPVAEVECDYSGRIAGTASKLNKWRDGWRILRTIMHFMRLHRPMVFFGSLSGVLLGASLALFYPIFVEYLETGLVPRLPTFLLTVGMTLVAALSAMCGVILDSTIRMQLEVRRLLYLNAPRAMSPPTGRGREASVR